MTTEQRIYDVICQELGLSEDRIYSEARLRTDLGMDSHDAFSLWLALEDEFELQIPDYDMTDLQTVREVVHYISSRVGSTAA